MQNIDSENRKADMTKIKAMRPRKSGYALLLPKEHDYSIILSSEQTAFPSLRSILLPIAEYYSIHSGIRIGLRRTHVNFGTILVMSFWKEPVLSRAFLFVEHAL